MLNSRVNADCHNCRYFKARPDRQFCERHNFTIPFLKGVSCRNFSSGTEDSENENLESGFLYYHFYPERHSRKFVIEKFAAFNLLTKRIWFSFVTKHQKYGWSVVIHGTNFPEGNVYLPKIDDMIGFTVFPVEGKKTLLFGENQCEFEALFVPADTNSSASRLLHNLKQDDALHSWVSQYQDIPKLVEEQKKIAQDFAEHNLLKSLSAEDEQVIAFLKDAVHIWLYLEEIEEGAIYRLRFDRNFNSEIVLP